MKMNREKRVRRIECVKRTIQIVVGIAFLLLLLFLPSSERAKAESGALMIDSVAIEKGDFSPGSTAILSFKIKSVGLSTTANDIIVEFSSDSEITPVFGESNQKYISSITPAQAYNLKFEVNLPSVMETERAQVALQMTYELNGEKNSNTAKVYVPIQYNSGVVVNGVSVAESAKIGSKALISITYANGSDETLKDVTFHLDGNIEEGTNTVEIGNLESGASNYQDVYVIFNELGEQTVDISVSYTDMEGNKFTKDVSSEVITVSNEEMTTNNEVVIPAQDGDSIAKKLVKIAVLIGIFAVIGYIIVLLTKKKE